MSGSSDIMSASLLACLPPLEFFLAVAICAALDGGTM